MNLAVEAGGWLGAALVVIAFAVTTLGWLPVTSRWSSALNIVGGIGLMINAAANTAWPSAVLNLVWLGIAAAGWYRTSMRPAVPGSPCAPCSSRP